MSVSSNNRINELVQELGGPETEDVLCAPRIHPGEAIAPLASAFQHEGDHSRRVLLLHAIWQLRDRRAVPILIEALSDRHSPVWKEALDGLVALGGADAITAPENASATLAHLPDAKLRLDWCREALEQARTRQAG